jgi:hypothetical protein
MPPEISHLQNPSNVPPHRLRLRVGAPVILLRNVDPTNGLCNGTRLIIEHCGKWVLQARILCGAHKGSVVLVPRMDLITGDGERLPFTKRRRQFPVALTLSMTINKSQQSLSLWGCTFPSLCSPMDSATLPCPVQESHQGGCPVPPGPIQNSERSL